MGKFACRWCEDTKLYQPLTGPSVPCSECSAAPTVVAPVYEIEMPETLMVGQHAYPVTEEAWAQWQSTDLFVRTVDLLAIIQAPSAPSWINLELAIIQRIDDRTKPRFFPKNLRQAAAVVGVGPVGNIILPNLLPAPKSGVRQGCITRTRTVIEFRLDKLRMAYPPDSDGEFGAQLAHWPGELHPLMKDLVAAWNWSLPTGAPGTVPERVTFR